eukprot:GILJ01018077.1.p1 GENE.GILJ01018077.1~~GILJ01018077.1.p1  ORF type:complete len:349 (-),score=20.74 GILJ01018077.1:1203-2249(-)
MAQQPQKCLRSPCLLNHDDILPDDATRVRIKKCGHMFHKRCLQVHHSHQHEHASCPHCSMKFDKPFRGAPTMIYEVHSATLPVKRTSASSASSASSEKKRSMETEGETRPAKRQNQNPSNIVSGARPLQQTQYPMAFQQPQHQAALQQQVAFQQQHQAACQHRSAPIVNQTPTISTSTRPVYRLKFALMGGYLRLEDPSPLAKILKADDSKTEILMVMPGLKEVLLSTPARASFKLYNCPDFGELCSAVHEEPYETTIGQVRSLSKTVELDGMTMLRTFAQQFIDIWNGGQKQVGFRIGVGKTQCNLITQSDFIRVQTGQSIIRHYTDVGDFVDRLTRALEKGQGPPA